MSSSAFGTRRLPDALDDAGIAVTYAEFPRDDHFVRRERERTSLETLELAERDLQKDLPFRYPRPVLQSLGDVSRGDLLLGREVGDRARQFQHPVVGAGGEPHLAHGRAEQCLGGVVEGGLLAQLFRTHVGVGQQCRTGEPRRLDGSCAFDALLDGPGELPWTTVRQLLVGDARHVQMDVDAVQQRPTNSLLRDAALPCRLVPIMITGGQTVAQTEEQVGWVKEIGFHVPKRDLVGVLAVLFQSQRMRIARDLPVAQLLVQELLNFRVKISLSGRDSYGAGEEWRDGAHDDLVLAVALASWYGENAPTPPMGVVALGAARVKPAQLGFGGSRRSWY
jgi:hypothetical protein